MSKMNTKPSNLPEQRFIILSLADSLGNVTEACRICCISRSQFYEYRRRFLKSGLAGLQNLPPIHKSHPQTTPPAIVKRILDISLENPLWGCVRISKQLKLMGISISSPSIQKVLLNANLESIQQRCLRLEEQVAFGEKALAEKQVRAIEKVNPCFKERHNESARPGEVLWRETFFVGHLKNGSKIILHVVVETFSSFAFAQLSSEIHTDNSTSILDSRVLPKCSEWGIEVSSVHRSSHRAICLREKIEHRIDKTNPNINGFMECFRRTVFDEFFKPYLHNELYETLQALQKDLDVWIKHYNENRPHPGYRNMGKSPLEVILEYLNQIKT